MKNKITLISAFLAASSLATAEIVINDFLSFEGFVDMSYSHTDTDSDGSNNSYGLDQVEINWLFNFVVGQSFPLVAAWLGAYAFVPFGGILVAAWVFAWRAVPETRGKSLEQIEGMLREPPMRLAGRSATTTRR